MIQVSSSKQNIKDVSDLETCMDYFELPGRSWEYFSSHSTVHTLRLDVTIKNYLVEDSTNSEKISIRHTIFIIEFVSIFLEVQNIPYTFLNLSHL